MEDKQYKKLKCIYCGYEMASCAKSPKCYKCGRRKFEKLEEFSVTRPNKLTGEKTMAKKEVEKKPEAPKEPKEDFDDIDNDVWN